MEEDRRRELLLELLVEAEDLRNRIPQSIADGSLESVLEEIASYLDPEKPIVSMGFTVYKPLYRGLRTEAIMLAKLVKAVRFRIEYLQNERITGLDYLIKRIDGFLRNLRASLGLNPDIPASLNRWRLRRI